MKTTMKIKYVIIFLLFVFILPLSAANPPDFEYAANVSRQSVVYIAVYASVKTSQGVKYTKTGYGSGTIVDEAGHIVTNFHVVKGGDYFQAVLYNGAECSFEKINKSYYVSDKATDIAVMKMKRPSGVYFRPIKRADSSNLKAGQWVIAAGSPYGLKHSITFGIVSSIGRFDVGFAEIEDFIQTDVPINPGNSGGPLINIKGEMVGINTAIRTVSGGFQGISFAIPSNLVFRVYSDLINYGYVRRGWLGLLVKNEFRESGGDNYNVRVVSVLDKSPAQFAGIRKGDLVREVDDEIINSKGELLKIVKNRRIGNNLTIVVDRNGTILSFKLRLIEKRKYLKYGNDIEIIFDKYGFQVDLDAERRRTVITHVSAFKLQRHKNAIRQGDIVLSINNKTVSSPESFFSICRRYQYKIKVLNILRDNKVYVIKFGK